MTLASDQIRAPYKTVAAALRHEIDPIKGSRFIADIRPVDNAANALAVVEELRRTLPDASHHCWAFNLRQPSVMRSSDDGEPGGSAGRPILAVLTGRELFNVVAVVTRYFGGTKLGVGGLMRAYSGAAAKALDRADIITVTPRRALWLSHRYEDTAAIAAAFAALDLVAVKSTYAARVEIRIDVPDQDRDRIKTELRNCSSGRVEFLAKRPSS